MSKPYAVMPSIRYPLRHARKRSQHREWERWIRLSPGTNSRQKAILAKQFQDWSTVRLRKHRGKWFLVYHDTPLGTGGFPTFQKAVQWYARGGR